MKRIALIWCLVVLLGTTGAYRVHEDEPKEDGETTCENCQQTSATVIDGTFNKPSNETTSGPAQVVSPKKPGKTVSELKIPVKTSEAKGKETKLARKSQRRYDQEPKLREQIRKSLEAQREQQRVHQRQLHRRQLELLQRYSKRLQQRVLAEQQERSFYRDPFGFNAIAEWIVGPRVVIISGHGGGHGDGHVYQYYNREKPLHFGGQPTRLLQATTRPLASTTASTATKSRQSKVIGPTHLYAVHEAVDEGANPFTWPNWFGVLSVRTATYPLEDNNGTPRGGGNYAKARKYDRMREDEIANNEIDAEGDAKVFFPPN
ncbi:uncharacterized protein LOC106637573 isoform X2 [Copidosoma floridanum]|uniref:uncharacterized protein LOC106637573 isoform X2 n=1 Tax=Copidosoma floridanum TaxID=29053 RepID=UPI0006C9A994|nr:uncharacterized protein LOC106637573 isoform X2 [Copidosoma floridanum]